ncbi:MAG: bifunctional precorrin-2 dehydrogenase/sirohydrochlorin ferrochelatase [Thermoplasmata archaeon]|nr:bifunctional precorrin-2 dehydrogenase/sirohydrochlorin ferrochelatase [Thermoplasmata archaeon]
MDKIDMSPILLSPGNRLVAVFGGGQVALRKCRHFAGFRIRVVSAEVLPELEAIADEVIIDSVDRDNVLKYIEGADIVVAATSDHSLNDMIRDTSMSRGIMTNSAHGGGDVLIPSTLRRDGWTVCVSSEGRVPAFPPYVIEKIDGMLDRSYDEMLALLVDLRADIRDKIDTQPARAEFLARVLADSDIWALLEDGKRGEARSLALERGGVA